MICNRCGAASDDSEGWAAFEMTVHSTSAFDICPSCVGAVIDAITAKKAMTDPIRLRTPEELSVEIAKPVARALTAEADNARLRALLKGHEWDQVDGIFCSSCLELWDNEWEHTHEHHSDCPAFTPDGTVK